MVLVVEDDSIIAEGLKLALTGEGMEVALASSVAEAYPLDLNSENASAQEQTSAKEPDRVRLPCKFAIVSCLLSYIAMRSDRSSMASQKVSVASRKT